MSDRFGKIDEFESVFKAADKNIFRLREVSIDRVLFLTDRQPIHAVDQSDRARRLLATLIERDDPEWNTLHAEDFGDFSDLRRIVEDREPGLVIAKRNLFDPIGSSVHSLGFLVDELTQTMRPPVLVLPDAFGESDSTSPRTVMVVTNRLTGEDRLVSKGVHLTPDGGTLVLCHLEDEETFDRYMHVIERISSINTDTARSASRTQLLNEPSDYIESCVRQLSDRHPSLRIVPVVEFGRGVGDFRRIVKEQEVDMLVFYTKDESQIAMHGVAYSLAVEFRDRSVLML